MNLTPATDSSKATGAPLERVRFNALGTQCEIQFVSSEPNRARAFVAEATGWVKAFEAKYSRFRPDSLIGRINAAAGRDWVAIDEDAERMFALADQVFIITRGILDPTMLPLMRLWNYRSPTPRVPTRDEVRETLARVGWKQVRREPGKIYLPQEGMGLDLGGFGKEYAVDQVAAIGLRNGITNLLIDFGHDVRVNGSPAGSPCWIIGVEDPRVPGTVRGRLAVNAGGIATSGDYVRFFEAEGRRYGHIVDPRTGYPVSNRCRSATVVANSCLEAGLLTTTAFVLGPEEGMKLVEEYFGAEGCICCDDRELQTKGYYRYVV